MPLVLTIIFLVIAIQLIYSAYYFKKGRNLAKTTYTGSFNLGNRESPALRVFIGGDSVATGVGASSFETSLAGRIANYLAQEKFIILTNEAVNGSKMEDLTTRHVPSEKQDLIILVVSSNDLFHFTNLQKFEESTRKVLENYSKNANKLIIIGPGRVFDGGAIPLPLRLLYKIRSSKYEAVIGKYAKAHENVIHISPLNPPVDATKYKNSSAGDKFHPNDEGHRFWFDMIKTAL